MVRVSWSFFVFRTSWTSTQRVYTLVPQTKVNSNRLNYESQVQKYGSFITFELLFHNIWSFTFIFFLKEKYKKHANKYTKQNKEKGKSILLMTELWFMLLYVKKETMYALFIWSPPPLSSMITSLFQENFTSKLIAIAFVWFDCLLMVPLCGK